MEEIKDSVGNLLKENADGCAEFETSYHDDILSDKAEDPFVNLVEAISNANTVTGALLRVGDSTIALQVREDGNNGSTFVFDSHARNESGFRSSAGTAILMKFRNKHAFHSYLKRCVLSGGNGNNEFSPEDIPDKPRSFELMPVLVKSTKCLEYLINMQTTRSDAQ